MLPTIVYKPNASLTAAFPKQRGPERPGGDSRGALEDLVTQGHIACFVAVRSV